MIQFSNVTKIFEGFTALSNITLSIKPNDFFGIIGMSGAGKSTLIRLVNGLIKPDEGEIQVMNQTLSQLNEHQLNELRSEVGMIFQHFNLLNQRNVIDNVALPLKLKGVSKKERHEKAKKILELVGLSDKVDAYPAQLSGGQKQRVAIARALVNDNKLLLCDEATSALDPISTQSILTLLKDLQKKLGLTVVMITHEMAVIEQVCNKVAILDQGHLVETGNVTDVFKHPQHKATKKLLGIKEVEELSNDQRLRLVFDGTSAKEPIIAEVVLLTGQKVNILQADTKVVEDKLYGQMVIALNNVSNELLAFLKDKDVAVTSVEESENV